LENISIYKENYSYGNYLDNNMTGRARFDYTYGLNSEYRRFAIGMGGSFLRFYFVSKPYLVMERSQCFLATVNPYIETLEILEALFAELPVSIMIGARVKTSIVIRQSQREKEEGSHSLFNTYDEILSENSSTTDIATLLHEMDAGEMWELGCNIPLKDTFTYSIQNGYFLVGGGHSHRLNFLSEVSFRLNFLSEVSFPSATPATPTEGAQAPSTASTSFSTTSDFQIITQDAGNTARAVEENSLVIPEFYQGETLVVRTSAFGSIVSRMFGYHVRRLISKKYLFRKVKVDVLDPPVTAGEGSVPLAARRRTENYSFVCPSGFTGLADGEPNEKALCFNRYCGSSSIEDRRASSVSDRPSRFLIRGCPLPENEIFVNPSVTALTTALTKRTVVEGVNNRTISFTPKENILNDLREINE
jgi:hypothetical protein